MWTEQTAFIELGKNIYLSNESNGGYKFEGLVGWGEGCVHGKGQREKKEGLK